MECPSVERPGRLATTCTEYMSRRYETGLFQPLQGHFQSDRGTFLPPILGDCQIGDVLYKIVARNLLELLS